MVVCVCVCPNFQWRGINWVESNVFWITSCICQGNGTVDESLCIANIRSEFNLGSNNQGHYSSMLEDIETDTAFSVARSSRLKVLTRLQLWMEAGMLVDTTGSAVRIQTWTVRVQRREVWPMLIIE